jgi:hypothetical protein
MKKKYPYIFIFIITISSSCFGQISIYDAIKTGNEISKNDRNFNELPPELIQTFGIETSLPQNINYQFENGGKKLTNRLSFASFYTINYPLLKKLTFGVICGIQHQSQGGLTGLKVGGLLRYYFKNYESANFYFMTAKSIGVFGKIDNSPGYGNARFGLEFPIKKYDDINLTFNIFWDNDSYKLKKPIIKNEKPRDITYHEAYGIGIGIQF